MDFAGFLGAFPTLATSVAVVGPGGGAAGPAMWNVNYWRRIQQPRRRSTCDVGNIQSNLHLDIGRRSPIVNVHCDIEWDRTSKVWYEASTRQDYAAGTL
jgi:hypothetical protein